MPSLWPQVVDTVCSAGVLPRKELFEAWEVAVCVDAAFPAIPLVADLAAGHGLLAWLLLLLGARRGVRRRAVCVDTRLPDAALSLSDAFGERWPQLRGQHQYVEGTLDAVSAAPGEALFTSVHACGPLSDRVIERAVASACPVALVPCCHSLRKQPPPPPFTRSALEAAPAPPTGLNPHWVRYSGGMVLGGSRGPRPAGGDRRLSDRVAARPRLQHRSAAHPGRHLPIQLPPPRHAAGGRRRSGGGGRRRARVRRGLARRGGVSRGEWPRGREGAEGAVRLSLLVLWGVACSLLPPPLPHTEEVPRQTARGTLLRRTPPRAARF